MNGVNKLEKAEKLEKGMHRIYISIDRSTLPVL